MTHDEDATGPLQTIRSPVDRDARREGRSRLRRRRRQQIAGAVALGAIALSAAGLLGSAGDGIPPDVSVGGIDVGGLSIEDARARLTRHATTVREGQVRLTIADEPTFSMRVPADVVASRPRLDEAIAAARSSRSRVGTALARLGLAGRKELPLRFAVPRDGLNRIIRDAHAKIGRKPVSATVAVQGSQIVTTPAKAGRTIDRASLAERFATVPATVELPVRAARPPGDDDDASRARDVAVRLTAQARNVTLGERSAILAAAVVRKALRFPLRKDTIAVDLDPEILRETLLRPLAVNERPPADARLEIRGNRVAVIPAKPGRRLNARALGATIVAAPEALSAIATVATTSAAFSTADAKALGIKEKVSEFTTPYQCCPPRVTNIRRGAQILDGRIIPAGNRFSLNNALGERTTSRGFVEAPAIAAGELVDSVGGGVSQIATTTYNAAFFAGLELQAHTPHEFYISRYPMGREATVSWRQPDLVFRNDWPAAILMSVRAASNGITVALYSSKLGRRVETTTGRPTNYTEPKTIERKKPDLPPGTRTVIQAAGPRGFSITYTRKVFRGNTLKSNRTFSWRYRPENAIVEVGPPAPQEPDAPDPKPPTGTTTTPKPTPTTPTTPNPAPTPTTPPGVLTPPTAP